MPYNPITPSTLPNDIRGREPGSWANHTVHVRLPRIIADQLAMDQWDNDTRARLNAISSSLPTGQIRSFDDPMAPDNAAWARYVQPWLGQNWLSANWFFVECYFYRRLLTATGYFAPGAGERIDPFAGQKEAGLQASSSHLASLVPALRQIVSGRFDGAQLNFWLQNALWGNQADLSIWAASDQNQPLHQNKNRNNQLLVDDRPRLTRLLGRLPLSRIDIILDNAGIELTSDLLLADYLLTTGVAAHVALHAKAHPTFVSDATRRDILKTIRFLTQHTSPTISVLGERLGNWVAAGQLLLREHFYWTAPRWFWELDHDLARELSQSQLIISKGDANYRRIAGDFHWPANKPFNDIAAYSPAPLLVLRTLKSELILGLDEATVARLNQQEPAWRTNGCWGVIQLAA